MSLFAKRTIIPDHYRPQSEIGDWLPGAKLIQEEKESNFIEFLIEERRKRDRVLLLNLFLLAVVVNLSVLITAYSSNLFQNKKIGNLAFLVITAIDVIFVIMAFIISFGDVYRKYFESDDEPNYRTSYKGNNKRAFEEVLTYWEDFLKSDSPIYALSLIHI